MFLYTVVEAFIGLAAYILLATLTKKADGVTYGRLDRAGRITNILLILIYICLSPMYLFLGVIATPSYEGILGLLGLIVSIIMASAAMFCGVGLGLSVAFRKMGKSRLSFAVQFAGFLGIGMTIALFYLFYGNLLRPLN